ncbi:MAG: TonB family protein [Pseudobdellovibrio sp.]
MSFGVYDSYFEDSISYRKSSKKYFGLSLFVHGALAVGVIYMSVPVIQKIQSNEPIMIELKSSEFEEAQPALSTLLNDQESSENAEPSSPAVVQKTEAEDTAPREIKQAQKTVAPAKIQKATATPKIAPTSKPVAATTSQQTATPSQAAFVPESIDDIATPSPDFDGVETAQAQKLNENAFDLEFQKIDQVNAAALQAEEDQFNQKTQRISQENDTALKALEDQFSQDSANMNQALEATRSKNAQELARIQAAEAEKVRQQQALLQAQKSAQSGKNNNTISGNNRNGEAQASASNAQNGQGLNGSGVNATGSGAGQGKVRSIDQLRQMPGNPMPQYSVDERLNQQQGKVTFQAYVTPDGRLTQFKRLNSTGYENLDSKTLTALRKWKFYPGQEGWVEIPQVWSLKGDVEQAPTLLRRR